MIGKRDARYHLTLVRSNTVAKITINVPTDLDGLTAEEIVEMAVRGYKDWKYRTNRNKENSAIIKAYRKANKK